MSFVFCYNEKGRFNRPLNPNPLQNQPRKTPKQERSAATVAAILTACAELLVREGYEAVGVTGIAERAGVSVGSLYQYFPNKPAIIAALIETEGKLQLALLLDIVNRKHLTSLESIFRTIVDEECDHFALNPALHDILIKAIHRLGRADEIKAIEFGAVKVIRALIEKHRPGLGATELDKVSELITFTVLNMLRHCAMTRPEYLRDVEFRKEMISLVMHHLDKKVRF